MKLKALTAYAALDCPYKHESDEVSFVVSNSHKICRGCVFVCIEGAHFDGHVFIRDALDAGATAVIVKKGRMPAIDCDRVIETEDTRLALAYLLDAFYGYPARDMKLVAVTGTNGKTTLTNILKAVFETAGYRCGLVGTLGAFVGGERIDTSNVDDPLANMTTPDPEQLYRTLDIMKKRGAQYVFMEASSHALYYEKLAPLKFECSVFTNLTPEHLDFHGSMEYYLNAKCKLFYASRLAVLNRDCEYYEAVRKCCERSVACSIRLEDADYLAGCIDISLDGGTRYTLKTRAESYDISSALVGEFNVMNTLQAIATAMELGVNISDIKRGLKAFCGVSGRLERVNVADGSRAVFIDYAHTPDALSNVLSTLTKLKKDGQRLTVLFGCGGDRDKSKRAEMGIIATTLADYTIITSDNCRSEARGGIISDILRGVGNSVNYTVVPDRKEALCLAAYLACRGDAVVLAGKGHEKYEIIGNERQPFDEYAIIKDFISSFGANDERKRY